MSAPSAAPGGPANVRVPRVRPYFGRLWYAWRDGRTLARVRRLVPAILSGVPGVPGVPPRDWVVQRAQWSATGVAVLALGPAGASQPAAVLKAGYDGAGVQGLRAQAHALNALHADARLGDWRALLPRTLAEGEVAGLYYALQAALPGREASADAESRGPALARAAEALRPLHARTAMPALAGEPFLAQAIEQPIELLRGAVRSELPVQREEALERLAAELREALAGRALRTGWIHGDFWLGNVLVVSSAPGGAPGGAPVTGIVDWSMAAPHALALHDVLHLILHMRQTMQGCELGDVVCAVLSGAEWTPAERALLEAEDLGLPLQDGGERALVLLYWLRRLKCIFEQGRGHARNKVWVAWNVDRVLQCL
jgi:hypothetical protein